MEISAILEPYLKETGGVLSALHAVQHHFGYLPENTEHEVAAAFNLSRAEVKGVISFYSDFRQKPVEGVEVRICAAEACQAAGGRALEKQCSHLNNEPIYCLGLCSVAPAAQVGNKLIGRADSKKIENAIATQNRQVEQ